MKIQINTDRNIEGCETLATHVGGVVESALSRFRDRITRVEVHMSDESGDKKGSTRDLRCMMEARLERRQPIAVSHQAATLDIAVDEAAGKLTRLIESIVGKLHGPAHAAGKVASGKSHWVLLLLLDTDRCSNKQEWKGSPV